MIHDITTKNWMLARDAKILDKIHLPTTNITIYTRDVHHLTLEIKQLLLASKKIQVSGKIESITKDLKQELNQYQSLLDDVLSLLHQFERITKAETFRLTIATVQTNMCRKFHTDINDLRMLCTYFGPGTLWIKDENVNQQALDSTKEDEPTLYDESNIERVQEGAVVILKGALYPSKKTNAIVHRSPNIEKNGEQRLLLRIDTNEFLNFDL
jgi:hypothetical protein